MAAMSDKSSKLSEFFNAVRPGGVARSSSGTAIDVSSNGTTTVPAHALETIILKRFAEMTTGSPAPEDAHSDQTQQVANE
jgi:hypothetical protein